MGAAVDKFMNFMKLDNKDEEYDDDYGFSDDETVSDPVDEPAEKSSKKPSKMFKNNNDSRRKNMSANVNAGVCMRAPKQLNDAAEVVDDLKSTNSVVLNLDGIDSYVAQSIYDFLCGACYALGCHMEKVSESVYVITPENVTLSGDMLSVSSGDGNNLF